MKNEAKQELEVWKTHPEFDFIEVSTLGRVKMLDRQVVTGKGGKLFVKGRILRQYRSNNGYLRVNFSLNGKTINRSIHRLVAECFLPNQDSLPQINHKNCDRTDNRIINLEWTTPSENAKYREKYGVSNAETLGHPLYAINLATYKVLQFLSQHEASRKLEINQADICGVLKGERNQACGYWFTEDESEINKDKLHKIKSGMLFVGGVFTVNLETLEVLQFSSQREAGRELGINIACINNVLKGRQKQTGGYWIIKDDGNATEAIRAKFGNKVDVRGEDLMAQVKMKKLMPTP